MSGKVDSSSILNSGSETSSGVFVEEPGVVGRLAGRGVEEHRKPVEASGICQPSSSVCPLKSRCSESETRTGEVVT